MLYRSYCEDKIKYHVIGFELQSLNTVNILVSNAIVCISPISSLIVTLSPPTGFNLYAWRPLTAVLKYSLGIFEQVVKDNLYVH